MKHRRAYLSLADYLSSERRYGMTQTKLAKRAKIGQSHLSLIASGHRVPSLSVALRLAAITNIPIETLVGNLHEPHAA